MKGSIAPKIFLIVIIVEIVGKKEIKFQFWRNRINSVFIVFI